MPVSFTVFCHGTGRHRGRRAWDIVQVMHNCADGSDYEDYLILDGPAGHSEWVPKDVYDAQYRSQAHVEVQGNNLRDLHLMAGDFDPDVDTLTPKSRGLLNPSYAKMPFGTLHTTVQGKGVGSNVKHALAVIRRKFVKHGNVSKRLRCINLLGWSRGGVTCIKIANRLWQDPQLKHVPVNLFAVDPVPGDSHYKNADSHNIPPNVKNLIVLLAMHEKRDGFHPVDLDSVRFDGEALTAENDFDIAEKWNHLWLPLPGVHNSIPQPHKPLLGPGMIGFQLCYQFLSYHGTAFKHSPFSKSVYPINDKTMCWLYADMINKMRIYEAHGHKEHSFFKGGGEHVRTFNQQLHKYRTHGHLFLNEHHRRCFINAYPDISVGYRRLDCSATSPLDRETRKMFYHSYTSHLFPNWDDLGVVPAPGDLQNVDNFWRTAWRDELKELGYWDDIKEAHKNPDKPIKLKKVKNFSELK